MKEMYLVYGYLTRDNTLIWEVCLVDNKQKAQKFADLCQKAAADTFNGELEKGFTAGDSISVQNLYDPHAQYNTYNKESNGKYTVDTKYSIRRVDVFSGSINEIIEWRKTQAMMNKLQDISTTFRKSFVWPDKGEPDGWEESFYNDYSLLDVDEDD